MGQQVEVAGTCLDEAGMDDERFMREALAEARLAEAEGEVPIGSVVVHDGKVIARAHNRREGDEDPSAHAEFMAMTAAARALGHWRLQGCTVYVTLEPCCMCAGLMVNARVDRCVYGASDPKAGALGSLYDLSSDERLNHTFEVRAGVLGDECSDLLKGFFVSLRSDRAGEGAAATSDADGLAEYAIQNEVYADKGEAAANGGAVAKDGETAADGRAAGFTGTSMSAAVQVRPAPAWRPASSKAPRVLLAIDSFKGSATSVEVEAWLAEGIRHALPAARVTSLPIADGGDGTAEAVHVSRGGTWRTLEVHGPLDAVHEARYLLLDDDAGLGSAAAGAAPAKAAVVEMAEAAGITQSSCSPEDALAASTYGVGELMLDAIEAGARTLYVGLGGSATSDGGAGMLQALGARLLDAGGAPVARGLRGLQDVASIDLAPALETLKGVELVVLTDVSNPLVGRRGAVRVFGPQKGLLEDELDSYDRWMCSYAAALTFARDTLDGTDLQVGAPGARPRQLAGVPGAGAAGGLGAALVACGARLSSGIQTVLDLLGFDDEARRADLVVTGEGSLDAQTAAGKAPVGVAERAKAASPRMPVVAVCGGRADDLDAVYAKGIDFVLPIARRPMALDQAMGREETHQNLVCAGEAVARAFSLGR